MTAQLQGLSGKARTGRSDLTFRGTCRSLLRVYPFVVTRALRGNGSPWHGEFIREAWRFRTVSNRKIALHYAPELGHDIVPEMLLVHWTDETRQLEEKFAFRLRQVRAFLFPAIGCISQMFGPEYGALALPSHNAIVVADHANTHEDVRHELVHLFAHRWNQHAPPLLTEGLAMHVQQESAGQPVAALVRRCGGRSEWTLSDLLDRRFFFDPAYRHACYVIAGSFSGFLIDEFGWQAYQQLYRCCHPDLVEGGFQRSLGISFKEAEQRWRQRL